VHQQSSIRPLDHIRAPMFPKDSTVSGHSNGYFCQKNRFSR
jgi:hypothetical protein